MTYLWPLNIHLFLDCMTFWIKFTISSKSFKTLELSSYILVKSETYMCVGHLQCDSNFPAFASKSNDFPPLPNCLQMVSISRLHLAFPQFLQFTPSFYVDLFGLFLSEYTISKCEILWLSSLWEIHVLFPKKDLSFPVKICIFPTLSILLPFPFMTVLWFLSSSLSIRIYHSLRLPPFSAIFQCIQSFSLKFTPRIFTLLGRIYFLFLSSFYHTISIFSDWLWLWQMSQFAYVAPVSRWTIFMFSDVFFSISRFYVLPHLAELTVLIGSFLYFPTNSVNFPPQKFFHPVCQSCSFRNYLKFLASY